ncbi:DNA polymerase delta small subunit [Plasmodium brasilianum]|uniref:DNA polymerase delta small subunit, putative n=2 Tax=Plasmodium (Plasmodium) TaxID=418103 RepID=A0A1A8VYZ6_PLAMA|nr:DNA polymerase delta small subunit, putative [Plasmodium malariae]KAI4839003.1 DNA polymerase delta small subunit [Plasmodium brasilianum]SBS84924.1 DNA polymerase epsilon subunit b, putative [Plasmodium malariae]SCN12353.1 DNA polymerase delta small subunit, putative [Plasmodium malariae]
MNAEVTDKDVKDIIKHINVVGSANGRTGECINGSSEDFTNGFENDGADETATSNECEFPLSKKIKKQHYCYENLSKEFVLTNPTYTQQFSEIYSIRIKIMKKLLMRTVEALNGEDINIKKEEERYNILNYLKEIKVNEKCYCIGTLFKKMQLRPSILKEYLSEIDSCDNIINYSHDEDVLFLEDETARLKLEGNINSADYITGLTIIIKGIGMSNGSLYVEELIYSYTPKLDIHTCISNDNKYILFVSGLYINELNKNVNNLSLLRNFILGLHGDKTLSANLIRLVIVGNSLSNINNDEKDLNTIDIFLSSLCSAVYVDLMPGEKDPSDANLPQQPFPNFFFKKSKKYNSFQCVTNPYIFSIDNVNICCMSGESVHNIISYSQNTKINALRMIAKSRILSPTSPDTLGCYPFTKNDPFCLHDDKTYPHIFVNGNCNQLEIEYMQNGTNKLPLLVCLPSFDITPKALLINIKNMQYKILTFDTHSAP